MAKGNILFYSMKCSTHQVKLFGTAALNPIMKSKANLNVSYYNHVILLLAYNLVRSWHLGHPEKGKSSILGDN